jgi:hypothetical protein
MPIKLPYMTVPDRTRPYLSVLDIKTTIPDRITTVLDRTGPLNNRIRPYPTVKRSFYGTFLLQYMIENYGYGFSTVQYGSFTVGYGLERFGSETLFYACSSCICLKLFYHTTYILVNRIWFYNINIFFD